MPDSLTGDAAPRPLCPECTQGKPANCCGETLAPDGSTMLPCTGLTDRGE